MTMIPTPLIFIITDIYIMKTHSSNVITIYGPKIMRWRPRTLLNPSSIIIHSPRIILVLVLHSTTPPILSIYVLDVPAVSLMSPSLDTGIVIVYHVIKIIQRKFVYPIKNY